MPLRLINHAQECTGVRVQLENRHRLHDGKLETQYRAKCLGCGGYTLLSNKEAENWNQLGIPGLVKIILPKLPDDPTKWTNVSLTD